MESINKVSRLISYVLRHNPNAIGIQLNSNGWANIDDLIAGLNNSGHNVDFVLLKKIVEEDSKCRFSFNNDLTKIRANQGHSINVEVEMTECIPPDVLYHGTAEKYLESIKQNGIIKKSRQYVHLSKDKETALKVGSRHGTPVVLMLDTKQMVLDGYKFLVSANGVWQSENIPWKYIIEILTV